MLELILMFLDSLLVGFRRRAALQAEIIALRHQLIVLQRTHRPKRLVLNPGDRFLLKTSFLLMIVEVLERGLLASSACGRPYNNDAEFPSYRASRPSCNAGRDHRVATSTDRAPTKSKVSATDAHSDGPLPLGLAVTALVGLAFGPNHRQA